jgi:hypothetical protein
LADDQIQHRLPGSEIQYKNRSSTLFTSHNPLKFLTFSKTGNAQKGQTFTAIPDLKCRVTKSENDFQTVSPALPPSSHEVRISTG